MAKYDDVLDRADRRCECTGGCGSNQHGPTVPTLRRCDRDRELVIAPADPTTPAEQAARLSADDLHVWCGRCHQKASWRRRKARVAARIDTEDAVDGGDL